MRLSLFKISIYALFMALASCSGSNDEPEAMETREIGFSTAASRALPAIDTDYNMWVTAVHHTDANAYYYFADKKFVYSSADSKWHGEKPIYYPASGTIDFFALASKNTKHLPIVSTNLSPNTTTPFDKDLFYNAVMLDFTTADNKLDGRDDVLVADVIDNEECGRNATTEVPLVFSHLLTNIQFRFYADNEETASFLKIIGVRLLKTHLSGKASLHRTNKDDPWKISWPADKLTAKEHISIEKPAGEELTPQWGQAEVPTIDFFLPEQATEGIKFFIYFKYLSEGTALSFKK